MKRYGVDNSGPDIGQVRGTPRFQADHQGRNTCGS